MILVVDEDVSFLDHASKILNRDRQVFLASDAGQAFDLAKSLGFSVALVNLNVKGKGGLLFIEQLRESCPELPIIAISGVLSEQTLEKVWALGVVKVLQKPITPEWKPIVEQIRTMKRH